MKKLSLLFTFIFILLAANGKATIKSVNVGNDFFDPAFFYLSIGDTIRWTETGSHGHTTTSISVPPGATTWNYSFSGIGDIYNYVVSIPGNYSYQCLNHGPAMSGSFIVLDNSLPLFENFDYPAGDTLTNRGWNLTGTSTVNPITVVSPGLSYSGYNLSGIGNAASLTTSGQDINKRYDSVTSGSIYASFMVNVTNAQAVGDYFLHLGVNPTNTFDFFARTFVKLAANGNLAFGVSKTSINASNPVVYSDSIYQTGITYLLVLKYTLNAGATNDTVKMFINPAITAIEPTANLTAATTQTDAVSLGTINFRQGTASSAANVIVDGIRIDTTWAGAVLPVELTSFTALTTQNGVLLNWATSTEINNYGFDIERKSANQQWQKIEFIEGNGTTSELQIYSYLDKNLNPGKYQYRLKQIDFDGSFEYSNAIEVDFAIPVKFELSQNYPNPFNPNTTITYSLPEASHVTLKVFNALGQEVASLVNGIKEAGIHKIDFNAVNLNSGIYFYKLQTGNFNEVRKMTLIK